MSHPSSAISPPDAGTSVFGWHLALAGLVALSLLPVAFVDIPAMVDYPNHLARMSVLARAATASPHPFYEVTWAPYPNLAMDLVVPALSRIVGVELATKLFYLAAQLLIVSGTMALSFAVRRKVLGAGVTACLFLYAMPFAFGFVNFAFALGIALWAFAAWMRLAEGPLAVRLVTHALAVAALFVCHLFALGLYGFAIGIVELWRLRRNWPGLTHAVILFAGMAAPVIVIGLVVSSAGGQVGGSLTEWKLNAKAFWILMLNGFDQRFSAIPTGILIAIAALTCLHGRIRFVSAGSWLLAAFGLLYLAMPFKLFDTAFVDGRVLLAAILIMPAFISVQMQDGVLRRTLIAILGATALLNLAFTAWVQADYRADYRALVASFDLMPRASRLLIAETGDADDPPMDLLHYPMHHAGTLAVHFRDAFVPTLFTYPGKQPIRPRPDVEPITLLEGGPIPMTLLEGYARGDVPEPRLAYVKSWTRDFDHLLLLRPGDVDPMPDRLERVASSRRFTLFRLRKGAPATPR